jgi:hypothetical protein
MFPLSLRRVLSGLLLLALPCVAYAGDDFSQFRIPANSYLDWTGSLDGYGNWRDTHAGPDHSSGSSWTSNLYSSARRWSENEEHSGYSAASVWLDGTRYHDVTLQNVDFHIPGYYPQSVADDAGRQNALEDIIINAQQSWYVHGSPWAVTGSVSGEVEDSQDWSDEHQQRFLESSPSQLTDTRRSGYRVDYRSQLDAALGVGFGRIRNATGLYEARVFEDRLLAVGALARHLSVPARQRLSDLMYARSNVDRSTSRPAADVMDAVERILFEDGALRDSVLTVSELFRSTEPIFLASVLGSTYGGDGLPASPITRQQGWQIRTSVTTDQSRETERGGDAETAHTYLGGVEQPASETRSEGSNKYHSAQTGLQALAEYHLPCGLREQWDALVQYDRPLRHSTSGFALHSQLNWTYIVADRWLASSGGSHARSLSRDEAHRTLNDSWSFVTFASVQYLLRDRLALSLGADESWSRQQSDFRTTNYVDRHAARWNSGGHIRAGVTYRFKGSARIAGVIPAMMGN